MSQVREFFVNNEFIQKLYMNEYFGVGLITVIVILASLFILVLILALRDAKKSTEKDESVKVLESNEYNDNFAFKETEPHTALEVNKEVAKESDDKDDEIKIIREDEKEDEFKTVDFNFKDVHETVDSEPTMNIDFNALAASLEDSLKSDDEGSNLVVNEEPVFDGSRNSNSELSVDSLLNMASDAPTASPKSVNDNYTMFKENEQFSSVNVTPKVNKVEEEPKLKVVDIEMPELSPSIDDLPEKKEQEPQEIQFASFKNMENETFKIR